MTWVHVLRELTNLKISSTFGRREVLISPFEKQEGVLVKISACCELQVLALLGTAAHPRNILARAGLDQEMFFSGL